MALTQIILEGILNNLTTLLVFLVVFILLWKYLQPSPYNFPPMPSWKIPFLGHLSFFNLKTHGEKDFWQAAKNLKSSTIAVKLGPMTIVILHKYEDMKECFMSDNFTGRGRVMLEELVFNGLLRDGPRWKEQRRFALSALRDLGLGKNRMEQKIQDECLYLTKTIEEYNGKPFDPTTITNTATSNIICSMVFGHRFEYSDQSFKRLMFLMNENFNDNLRKAMLSEMIPGTKYIPGDFFRMKRLKKNLDEIKETFLQPEFEQHLKTYDPNNIEDFIHAFIHEQKAREESTEQHWFNKQQLMWNIDDLFNAGTETTASTLRWSILCMLHNPNVYKKVRAEILDTIGPDRPVTMGDKRLLSYTEATINEIQRMHLIAPMGGLHSNEYTTEFKGYKLPPNTGILVNIYAIHHDPDHWDEPFKFKPERFIGPDGNFQKDDHIVPFSLGKHSCIGEGLARMEIFLFFVTLMQKFTIKSPDGHPLPPMEGTGGGTNAPKPYEVCFIRD
ncbi:unnamed protein product [Owenia fusiformis]|uniref:Uncharacterized protein n=1 Tax=Owenia fusiformis TaxID=6347 RepID=A0A8J1UN78_OWEFU|nr:unnamed protein product [Owenia fusiformis]